MCTTVHSISDLWRAIDSGRVRPARRRDLPGAMPARGGRSAVSIAAVVAAGGGRQARPHEHVGDLEVLVTGIPVIARGGLSRGS